MNAETIYDVVRKLIGQIEPYGDTNIDHERFGNLKIQEELIDYLIDDIANNIPFAKRVEFSLHSSGVESIEYLNEVALKIRNLLKYE